MRRRMVVVAVLASLWLAALGVRLAWLQVHRHDHYQSKAASQHRRVMDLEPPRGTIYDARGRLLAVSVEVDSAFADPSQVTDPAATAAALAPVLGVDAGELASRLGRHDRDFVFLARKLDRPQAAAVEALEQPGVHFLRESKRYYPMRELGSQLLGFVGTDHKGLSGLEAHYDQVVAGRAGRRTVLRDAHRRTLLAPRLAAVDAEPGADLHLTLDAAVQHIVEKELAAAVERFRARRGTVVLLDPASGAILAMATYPSFDPNHFADFPAERWRIGGVSDPYEPGSTFKVVTAAAVLSHGLLHRDDSLDCEMGGITLAGIRIRDHHPFGRLTLGQVIAKSSNVGVIKMGLLLGEQRLYDAIRAFGFGERTGVDLPGETPGILRPVERWSALSKAYISFGQEVSVSPLQLARAVAAVANGGTLLRPYVVEAVGDAAAARGPLEVQRAMAPEVAAELRDLMVGVVREGTGRAAAVPGYGVGGKTGTAQKVVGGRYSPTQFVASFVGFTPVSRPRLAAVVALDEPRPLYHGGQVAAPTFAAIARQVLLYWGVPPEPPEAYLPPPPAEPAAPRPGLVLAAERRLVSPRELATADPPAVEPQLLTAEVLSRLRSEHAAEPPATGEGEVPALDGVTLEPQGDAP
ncbi:MAG TPA: penicillin-binding protein 2 [Thermoanaerobaculia bacterium]|nr:penicillin-binding protein 2 [Thermoanaerobaculia bacterium]